MEDINKTVLDDDPEAQAIDADEEVQYNPTPDEDSGVVVVEPDIITYGRVKRKNALRNMQNEQQ